ncbi:MAG: CvpA family protein [Gemmataceae bacterium]
MQSQAFHGIDIAIVAALIVGASAGASRGVFRQTVTIVFFVASFYAAMLLHDPVEHLLRTRLQEVQANVTRLHSFLASFLATYVVTLVGSSLLRKIVNNLGTKPGGDAIESLGLRPLDRFLGAGVGVIAAGLLIGAGLLALGSVDKPEVRSQLAGSKLTPIMVERMRIVVASIPESCREDFVRAMRRLEGTAHVIATDLATDRLNQSVDGIQKASAIIRK